MEELTNRFTHHYIRLIEDQSDPKISGDQMMEKMMGQLSASYLMVRSFLTRLIGYLSKDL